MLAFPFKSALILSQGEEGLGYLTNRGELAALLRGANQSDITEGFDNETLLFLTVKVFSVSFRVRCTRRNNNQTTVFWLKFRGSLESGPNRGVLFSEQRLVLEPIFRFKWYTLQVQ